MTDSELLEAFARRHDERAFRELVERYADVVYSAAVRQIPDRALGDDVVQAVFFMLARKADRVDGKCLGGWLIKAARLAAMDAYRGERRRKTREQKAAVMKRELGNRTNAQGASETWDALSPLLDEAIARLGRKDRTVITLRYLQGKSIAEVASAMSISAGAAQRRLNRAVHKLRKYAAARGAAVDLAAIGALLDSHARLTRPAALKAKAGLTGTSAFTASATTAAIANNALAAMSLRPIWTLAAFVLAASFVGFSGVWIAARILDWTGASSTAPRALVTESPAAPGQIKVGWMVSYATASNHPYDKQHPFDSVTAIRPRFLDPQIALFAIVEPRTENLGLMPTIIGQFFEPGRIVNGADPAALSKLDVIVCSRDWHMQPEVIAAICKAVENGTGLLRHLGTGVFDGYDAPIDRINCIDQWEFFYTPDRTNCIVVSDHPILSGLRATLPNGRFSMTNVNGCSGIVRGVPLIIAEEGSEGAGQTVDGLPKTWRMATTAPTDRRLFCPLFISQMGKGKVIACQWDSIPKPLADLTKGRFYIHCVQWLANRPLN